MFCNYCGAPNPEDAAFCRGCGRARTKADAAPPPAPAPVPPPTVIAAAPDPPPQDNRIEPQMQPGTDAPAHNPSSGFLALFLLLLGLAVIGGLGYGIATFLDQRREAAGRDADSARALQQSLDKAGQTFHVAGTEQKAASPAPAPAVVSGAAPTAPPNSPATLDFPPDQNDADAMTCDRLADHPWDPQKVGDGVGLESIDVAQALLPCGRTASSSPAKPRYQYLYGRVLEAASRFDEAMQQYASAERAGYGMADMNIGYEYQTGRGVTQNRDLAARFLTRADEAGVPNLRSVIGDLWSYDAQQYSLARSWYEAAITRGEPQGYAGLAVLYDLGLGVDKDRVKGAELARKAAELGNINGMFWLGRHLRDGQGVERDRPAACGWFDKTARAGYAYGQLEAGRCFYTGDGGTRNHEYAFYWLIRAAQAGLPEAQEIIADMYDDGDGVAADETQAVAWYRKAAVQGDTYGMMQLGVHLRQGKGVAWSEAEAMQWFEKAARAGYAAAQSSLGAGYLAGLGQDAGQGRQDYQQAGYWFGEAIKQGEGFALVNLGVMYENGLGVPQDLERARQLYTQAAQSSNAAAAKVGQQYAANLSSPQTSEPQPGSLVRTKQSPSNADAWVAIVVGAVAIAAVTTLFGHSSSATASPSASSDDSYADTSSSTWTPSTDYSSGFSWPSSTPATPDPAPLHPYYPYQQWKTPNGDLTNPNIAWR
jgi:TPR repeat protein